MKYTTTITFLCLFTVLPLSLHAAVVSLTASTTTFSTGEEFLVTLDVDTQGDSINAVEGNVAFPVNLLDLKEIRDGDSLVTFWIEKPKIGSAGTIRFAGITPGGYVLPNGRILSLVFEVIEQVEGTIVVEDARAIENNEQANEAPMEAKPFAFTVSDTDATSGEKEAQMYDRNPPEKFEVHIVRNENVYGGNAFLVFASQDKGSGLSHFEIKEGNWSEYVRGESPHLLQNQKLDKKIYVRALDKKGNIRTSVAYPENYLPWYKNYVVLLGGLMVVGTILVLARKKISRVVHLLKTF